MTRTTDKTQLDRATDPEYAAVSSTAVIGLVVAVLGVWPLLLISKRWVEPPTSLPDLVVMAAIFTAAALVGLALSLTALGQIRRSYGVMTGRRIALAGLAVGAALAVAWTGWLTVQWRHNERTLRDLEKAAYAVLDDLLAGRYEQVYERIPQDFRRLQPAGYRLFRAKMVELFEDAGRPVERRLRSLRIEESERGVTLAPAEMRVELERRILQVGVTFGKIPAGKWEIFDIQAGRTFESMTKYGDADDQPPEEETEGPPTEPAPTSP